MFSIIESILLSPSIEKNSSWCVAPVVNEAKTNVKVIHIERGKFKIVSDEEGDNTLTI